MIIFVFLNFLAFWPFPWQRQPFRKNQHLKAQLHMAYDIPTRFHKVWRKKERIIIIIIIIIIITRYDMIWSIINGSQFQKRWRISIRKCKIYLETKFCPIRRILYFGGHFGFNMAAIANQTMDINLQHYNLLGSQILPKSEDFCILAAILDSKWPP